MGRPPKAETVEVLRQIALYPHPAVAPKHIAHKLPITEDSVSNRLSRLAEDGFLVKKDVGASATVYMMTEKGRKKLADAEDFDY